MSFPHCEAFFKRALDLLTSFFELVERLKFDRVDLWTQGVFVLSSFSSPKKCIVDACGCVHTYPYRDVTLLNLKRLLS